MEDLYPSRVGDEPKILERKDPVLYGSPQELKEGPLDQQQLGFYEKNGFLLLDNFFSAEEVAEMQKHLHLLWEENRNNDSPEIVREPGSDEIRSIFDAHRKNELFGRLSRDPRITDMISQILGSDIYVHQFRINFKPGFKGKEFYWHSDFETWHVEDGMPRMRAISCSILLTDNHSYNGPLLLIPGSHKKYVSCAGKTPENNYQSSLKKQELGVPDNDSLAQMVEEGGITTATAPAGSLLLFECNVMHGSNGNITPLPRSNVFFVFNSVKNQLVEPFSGLKPRPEYLANRTVQHSVLQES
ncbi:MAG: ectoine hydroxylase [Firmicutes bacterium]|uniref:Ectoine hydroxylase n=1 Tax=Melghirimyces thermohalophilus TaxID=1236220 RepID=A0A1G6MZZ0_9BACL|nr:ectoine hydroxylase [Melghirimyces thermohalophilus]MDA8351664.1 ectoine hydroxylase [Bacillota bacterium]SDC60757.1 ectoine hydroxylase [Melghirimyces thermohalophilus]